MAKDAAKDAADTFVSQLCSAVSDSFLPSQRRGVEREGHNCPPHQMQQMLCHILWQQLWQQPFAVKIYECNWPQLTGKQSGRRRSKREREGGSERAREGQKRGRE